jgi:hypothetical protein
MNQRSVSALRWCLCCWAADWAADPESLGFLEATSSPADTIEMRKATVRTCSRSAESVTWVWVAQVKCYLNLQVKNSAYTSWTSTHKKYMNYFSSLNISWHSRTKMEHRLFWYQGHLVASDMNCILNQFHLPLIFRERTISERQTSDRACIQYKPKHVLVPL